MIELTVSTAGNIVATQNPRKKRRRVDHQTLVDGLHCGILNGMAWLYRLYLIKKKHSVDHMINLFPERFLSIADFKVHSSQFFMLHLCKIHHFNSLTSYIFTDY